MLAPRRTLGIAFAGAIGAVAITIATTSLSSISAAAAPSVAITPASFSVTADGNVTYTATVSDSFGNSLDVTPDTTFSIAPDGSCSGRFCGSTVAGPHTVTASYQGGTATADLTVTPGQVARLVLSPATATFVAGGSQTYTAVAYDRYGNSFGDVTASTTFFVDSTATPCPGNTCSATTAGWHQVVGEWNTMGGASPLTVIAGPVDHITLAPATTTITAGGNQTYVVEAFDQYNNDLGNQTSASTLAITPDGTCSVIYCSATIVGPHTLTATYSGKTATATLTVTAGPFDHITISPATASIGAGASQTYTTEGFDQYGNDLGSATGLSTFVTGASTFAIAPDGSCTAATCTATKAGSHTVTATKYGKSASATLSVTPGAAAGLTISPASATAIVGSSTPFTAIAADSYGNSLGDVTAATTFSMYSNGMYPNGFCYPINGCGTTVAGDYDIGGQYKWVYGHATLTETPGPATKLIVNTTTSIINAGGSAVLSAIAYDQWGNLIGDVTPSTNFFAQGVTCSANVCSSTVAGGRFIFGTAYGVTGAVNLQVLAGPMDHISLTPATATVVAGVNQAYVVEAYDQYNNDLGNQASGSTLMIAPDGSCASAACGSTKPGAHTVTATDGGKTATAALQVNPGSLDHITLSPSSATITVGNEQLYAVEAFDAYNNDLGSATNFSLAIAPEGYCYVYCTVTKVGAHTVSATFQGKSATASLTVIAGPLAALMVTPSSVTLAVQASQVFTATGADAYGNVLSASGATWSLASRTPGALSSTTGSTTTFKASNHFTGTGSVTVSMNGFSGSAAITVIPATPSNLTANVKPTKVDLTWQAAQGANTYAVYRGTSSSNLALVNSGLTSTSFTDSPGSGTFYYYVVAVGPSGQQSAPSNVVSATFK